MPKRDDAAVISVPARAATRAVRSRADPTDVLVSAERRENRAAYRAIRLVTRALSRRWHLTVDGDANLPMTGSVIIAANHVSFIDSPLLMFCLPRRIWFLGKAEYMDSWKTRHLFPAVGMIPLPRGGRRAAVLALRTALEVLETGEAIGIYPEGTRSRDGKLHRGHTGLAWLALKSGTSIVPVGISGTAEVQPPGAGFPRLSGNCHIRIGAPITMGRYDGRDRRSHRILTDDVMFEIAQLSGQQYVDEYAEPPEPTDDGAAGTT